MGFDGDRLDVRDAALIERVLPLFRAFNRGYVRLRAEGVERIASHAPRLFVSNHNGGIAGPDLVSTLGTLWETLGPSTPLYALAHDFAMRQLTPLGRLLQRFGAIRATRANARKVLESGAHCLVYPGGDLDAYRDSRRRDEVIFGARTGFVHVARDTGAAIVPVVVHGAHRSAWVISDGERIARALGLARWGRLERFPIAIAAPWGFAFGPWLPYLPLPFPIQLRVLEPIPVAPDDDPVMIREHVRATMQAALDEMAR